MQFSRPESTGEALQILADGGEDCTVIAGGTAVMLMMRNGLLHPEHLVSIDRLPDLDFVHTGDESVRLGSLTKLRTMERSPALHSVLPTLGQTLGLVANHRVRQQATIGGNVSEADYASDPPAVLTTLDCRVRLVSTRGERWLPISEFLVDYYTTAKEPDELVLEVVIPRPSPTAHTTYIKYVSRSSEDRPCVGVAAYVDLDEGGRCANLRVAIAGATSTPFVLSEATDACRGATFDSAAWREVAGSYEAGIRPIDDVRGASAYRKHVTGELVLRALQAASSAQPNGAMRL